jgi:hypothetical protein
LQDLLPMAVCRLSSLDGLVAEGNSAIEFLKPDIVIFMIGKNRECWKTGTEGILSISDIIVYENESDLPEISKKKRFFRSYRDGIWRAGYF